MSGQRVALFTIASKNYLAYVRVLLKSVAAVHPDFKLYLCLADEAAPELDPRGEPYDVVQADALGIRAFDDMKVRYDIMELNTAVKPSMIRWLFDRTDADAVIYLDPDIRVYAPLDPVTKRFDEGASLVLTPHITAPLEDGKTPNDHHMLRSGVFNLGFIGVKRCDEALRFVDWWARRLATQAVSDVRNNLFTDQRWCDLAPCFVDKLAVLRDPGCNVAYWNLSQRHVAPTSRGGWTVDGAPLVFFHFSGVNIARRDVVSKHQDRIDWRDVPQVRPLFEAYFDALEGEGIEHARRWPYAYACAGGLNLSPLLRALYRRHHPEAPVNPREAAAGLAALACETEPGMPEDEPGRITRLMHLVHSLRPDLQAAFSLGTPSGRSQFCAWFAHAGSAEYGLPEQLIPLAREAPESSIDHAVPSPVPASHRAADNSLAQHWRKLTPAARRHLAPTFLALLSRGSAADAVEPEPQSLSTTIAHRPDGRSPIEALQAPAALAHRFVEPAITRLMHLVWRQRADLQAAFDLDSSTGQRGFSDWFRVGAPAEYGPHMTRETTPLSETHAGEPGANLIGYAHAEIGMGEHVRMTAAALDPLDVPFGVINVQDSRSGRQLASLDHGELIDRPRFKANLFHVNADQMLSLYGRRGPALFADRYNIGYWAWELSRWPAAWQGVLEMVNEVWAPSAFIHDAIAAATAAPVRLMPLCVSLPALDARHDRRHFGLDTDAYVFLYTFDFLSYLERKNPCAAVTAFRRAFPRGSEKVRLVLKTMNGDPSSAAWQRLQAAIDGDPRITLLDRTMERREVLGLCATSDAFVSLHRAEGFGRGPAEAMALGKPVIATAYSGNMDFTKPDTAFLVDYRLIPVGPGEYPMHEGQVWADADIDHAARHMRRLADNPAHGQAVGRAGQAYVREHFSQRAVGQRYAERLRELQLVDGAREELR